MRYVLAIDQGTTSSRAILFDENMDIYKISQKEFQQHFPFSGWVEHNADDIYDTVVSTCRDVVKDIDVKDIVSIGITNQRETTVVWDKNSGKSIYNAIVWQDRRTYDFCNSLKREGYEDLVRERTGLLLDPYFSGTKLKWILDNVDGAREKARKGQLLFGTVDSYLIWKLSRGKNHFSDATNAARTMLYNIKDGYWDKEICSMLDIPMQMLPEVKDCADDFGSTCRDIFGVEIPICGVAGDQQAATIGQACFEPGMMKSTYGTGCFALLNSGTKMILSNNRLLTTIAYRLNSETTYALEGSIFIAGAVVQWLRDGLKIIKEATEAQELAKKADDKQQLYIVPAFTGLGAPYWDAECRGAIFGITRNSGPSEFSKAALQSVGFQTKDLLEAMQNDLEQSGDLLQNDTVLRVDGGMSASDWTIQFLADILNVKVDRPKILETTALGVAWLAGMYKGFYPSKDEFAKNWMLQKRFEPKISEAQRDKLYRGWGDAICRTLSTRKC